MKTTYYSSSSNPRMETLHEDNLSDQVEFYTWDEDGIQRSQTYDKNNQLQQDPRIQRTCLACSC